MKKIKTQTMKVTRCSCGVLCVAVLAAFALFAACERPEPEPEPPTPPVVNPDTLPVNKFIGTWVLCAMNDVNSEPPATCDLADATTDTLVFVDDTTLILHRSTTTKEYVYEFSGHFLFCYSVDTNSRPIYVSYNRYHFRNDDEELVLCGHFAQWYTLRNVCYHRINEN